MSENLEIVKKVAWTFYKKPLLFFTGSVAVSTVGWRVNNTALSNIFVISGAVAGLISFLTLLSRIVALETVKARIRAEEANEEYRETYIKWPRWVTKWGGILWSIITIILIKLFASDHENSFGGNGLLWASLITTTILGIGFYQWLRFAKTSMHKYLIAELTFYFVIVTGLLIVAFSPSINRGTSKHPSGCKPFNIRSVSRQYLTINVSANKTERFEPPRKILNGVREGGLVILCVKKGGLGFDFVERFELIR